MLILLLLCCAAPALHAGEDPHFDGPVADLLRHCPFAHGYLHGYEEGFRVGDADFHLGRSHDVKTLQQTKASDGYHSAFGDHVSYRNGYREGLLAGYSDSLAGRDFRAYDDLRFYQPSTASLQFEDVDRGFGLGYQLGFRNGLRSLESGGDFDADPNEPCPAHSNPDGTLPPSSRAYCDGYTKAYAIGYKDAYLSSEETATELAARK